MSDKNINICYNCLRLSAMNRILKNRNSTVETELFKTLDELYKNTVPEKEREEIEAAISSELDKRRQKEKEEIQRAAEKRRFAVFHIRENGEDDLFESDLYNDFKIAAYRYRIYQKADDFEKRNNFAAYFIDSMPIAPEKFEMYCRSYIENQNITAILEFNLDNDTVSIKQNDNDQWQVYDLKDVSAAVYKAYRSERYTPSENQHIFDAALFGKEINSTPEQISGMEL